MAACQDTKQRLIFSCVISRNRNTAKFIFVWIDTYIDYIIVWIVLVFFLKNRLFILSFVFVFAFAVVDLPLFSVFFFSLLDSSSKAVKIFFGRTWFSMPLVVISFRSHFDSVLSLTKRLICVKEEKRKKNKNKNKNNQKQIRFGFYHALSCYRIAMF